MPLPFPVRIAAGLVATAVEQARDFPRHLIEFPVTAVSQALQASMRVQQRVTELAIKGDRALGVLRPVEEKPSWATFDEDEPPKRNGASSVTRLRTAGRATNDVPSVAHPPETTPARAAEAELDERIIAETLEDGPITDEMIADEFGGDDTLIDEPLDEAAVEEAVMVAEIEADVAADTEVDAEIAAEVEAEVAAEVEAVLTTDEPLDDDSELVFSTSTEDFAADGPVEETAAEPVLTETIGESTEVGDIVVDDLPPALPDYDNMTIPQLRGKLRFLSLEDLQALLQWETTHGERPPFLTMLTNRITTVLEG